MINFRKKSRKRWRTLQKQDRGAKPREQNAAFQGAKISHDAFQGANSLVERVAISHTSKQGAKLKARCEIPCSRCEFPKCHFRTPLYKVRKFSHRAKFPPGTRVPFSHTSSQISHRAKQGAKFSHSAKLSAKCYPRCEFLSPKGAIFAHLKTRCEISSPRCENFAR